MKASFPMWNIEPSETNIALWSSELSTYSVADLRRAYNQIINSGAKSPPTLPEVKAGCRGRPSDATGRLPDDQTLSPPGRVSKEKAEANIARLRRIMGGVELEIDKHCNGAHLSLLMQRRLKEIIAGFPTFNGKAINPLHISNPSNREAYEAEISAWKEENPNVGR